MRTVPINRQLVANYPVAPFEDVLQISDHQQSWGYEDGPWKGPGPPLLVAADFLKRILDK